jgi:hypothetical protein
MGLRDIVGSLGVVPRYLANKDQAKSDEISALQAENTEMKRKQNAQQFDYNKQQGMKKGGLVKSSASKRADGIAMKGKTKGRMV